MEIASWGTWGMSLTAQGSVAQSVVCSNPKLQPDSAVFRSTMQHVQILCSSCCCSTISQVRGSSKKPLCNTSSNGGWCRLSAGSMLADVSPEPHLVAVVSRRRSLSFDKVSGCLLLNRMFPDIYGVWCSCILQQVYRLHVIC